MLGFLRRSVRELGQTVVMVTHELDAAAYADDVVVIADGRVRAHLTEPDHDELVATLTRGPPMRTVLLASLRIHLRRYVAAALAVIDRRRVHHRRRGALVGRRATACSPGSRRRTQAPTWWPTT